MRKQIKKQIRDIIETIRLLRKMLSITKLIERLRIQIMIKRVAREEGLDKKDARLAIAIARCESDLNPKVNNTKGNHPSTSIDRGLFMWNDFYHPEITDECAYSAECATREFCKAYKKGKVYWWNASRHCWKKYLK